MATRSSLRASDADRDQVAERLRKAAAEGRILAAELEDRLATALRARTYGELDAVVSDLPGGRIAHASYSHHAVRRQPVATVAALVLVTLLMTIVAAMVIAGMLAASGVWILLGLFWLARGGGGRHHRHHHRGHAPAYRNAPSRW